MSSARNIPHDRTLRVIVSYKLVRGGLSLVGGLVLASLVLRGGRTAVERARAHVETRWGYGLVVGVAALFVPFELAAWWREPTAGRALLLIANVLVALYLARRVLREHRRVSRY